MQPILKLNIVPYIKNSRQSKKPPHKFTIETTKTKYTKTKKKTKRISTAPYEKTSTFIAANKYEVGLLKSEIIYCPHHRNSTKGVVVNNVHTIFRTAYTQRSAICLSLY